LSILKIHSLLRNSNSLRNQYKYKFSKEKMTSMTELYVFLQGIIILLLLLRWADCGLGVLAIKVNLE
jgi:hypothetical protein